MAAPQFHSLCVKRVSPEAAGAVAICFDIPPALRAQFSFAPGQYLTLRARINGVEVRRNYSICSPRSRLDSQGEIEIGIRPVAGGLFSNWAAHSLTAGHWLEVLPPEGKFVVSRPRALHRVGFAAGSGITPILSIMASTLEAAPHSKFTLVYGNRRMATVMFNEALQDLKDRYRDRLTLIHILSRQAQESDLLQGRIDGPKVNALMATLLPAASMDEVFVCGPDAMMDATVAALLGAGVAPARIHLERFSAALPPGVKLPAEPDGRPAEASAADVNLTVTLDGKQYELRAGKDEALLDAALEAGLDVPYSCKSAVCSTCRARLLAGTVRMDKNFTLDARDIAAGYILSCQARATSPAVAISYDDR
ncbi:MAG: 2Fe-2S iron-sulfur cluster binding domain-containing protein [Rhodocyclaceae bacterium]|nr:2Fe-2S iron-sulfur cluster binding domain-containing protein [Rhodocyclaceae bacterium]MBX3668476.1 2Fe-2S iron-sulfur cluster binding domain-containing protein [Rhodocyclaceae bacterium]